MPLCELPPVPCETNLESFRKGPRMLSLLVFFLGAIWEDPYLMFIGFAIHVLMEQED